MMPKRSASAIASSRLTAPSLARMAETWFSTLREEMKSRWVGRSLSASLVQT